MDLAIFYFSGTGNTRYIAERLSKKLSCVYRVRLFDITAKDDFSEEIGAAQLLLFAFPIYGSTPPIPMRRFVFRHQAAIRGKRVLLAETQYFFSGDGAASLGRAVARCGGEVIGAEHFNMPNNLSDCKIFSVKNGKELHKIIARADRKADEFAARILQGKPPRRGFRLLSRAIGCGCQRIFWRKDEAEKRSRLRVNDSCVGCGACAKECPVKNIVIENGRAVPRGECVLCYRCVNLCPRRALSLIGKSAPEKQYRGPYLVKPPQK